MSDEELRYADYCRTNPNWASRELVKLKATIAEWREAAMAVTRHRGAFDLAIHMPLLAADIDTLAALLEKKDE